MSLGLIHRRQYGILAVWLSAAVIGVCAAAASAHAESAGVAKSSGVTFLTPPYLQNMGPDRMVVMAEIAPDLPLVLKYQSPDGAQGEVAGQTTPSGGNSRFLRAVLTGLRPETAYRYYWATRTGKPVTEVSSFTTAPAGDPDFTFATLGDVQTTNCFHDRWAWEADPWEPAKAMLRHMAEHRVAFVLGLGDHAANGDKYSTTRNSHLKRFPSILGPAGIPFYIAWGNHDGASPWHPLRLSTDMPSRFRKDGMSYHAPGFGSYTFEYAGVFFICIEHFNLFTDRGQWNWNSNNDISNGWLEKQLASPAASNARFRILAIHVPPFCERWIDGNAYLRKFLVPLLEKYRIDLCLSGHMHGYERGELHGVHYVIAGMGSYLDIGEPIVKTWPHMTIGGDTNVKGHYAMQSRKGKLGNPQPIEGGLFHGYLQVHVRGDHITADVHGFNADGSPIGILDTFEVMARQPNTRPGQQASE